MLFFKTLSTRNSTGKSPDSGSSPFLLRARGDAAAGVERQVWAKTHDDEGERERGKKKRARKKERRLIKADMMGLISTLLKKITEWTEKASESYSERALEFANWPLG